jgi:hypothetical protein
MGAPPPGIFQRLDAVYYSKIALKSSRGKSRKKPALRRFRRPLPVKFFRREDKIAGLCPAVELKTDPGRMRLPI